MTITKIPTALQPAEKMKYLSELMVFQDLTSKEMEETEPDYDDEHGAQGAGLLPAGGAG